MIIGHPGPARGCADLSGLLGWACQGYGKINVWKIKRKVEERWVGGEVIEAGYEYVFSLIGTHTC